MSKYHRDIRIVLKYKIEIVSPVFNTEKIFPSLPQDDDGSSPADGSLKIIKNYFKPDTAILKKDFGGGILIGREGSSYYGEIQGRSFRIDLEGRDVIIALPEDLAPEVIPNIPLDLGLMFFLKNYGYYPLHASGGILNGKGILFPGKTGSGKSTLAKTLYDSGGAILSDDRIFLNTISDEIYAHSFETELLLRGDDRQRKIKISPGSGRSVSIIKPQLLLFPVISGTDTPSLRGISPSDGMERLLSLTLFAEKQEDLNFLSRLAQKCRLQELALPEAGPDPSKVGRILVDSAL